METKAMMKKYKYWNGNENCALYTGLESVLSDGFALETSGNPILGYADTDDEEALAAEIERIESEGTAEPLDESDIERINEWLENAGIEERI